MKKTAIIVAGGNGSRMQSDMPKQFLELAGKAILVHTVDAFIQAFDDISVIVVLPKMHVEKGRILLLNAFPLSDISFTEGGATRFHSVKAGLSMVRDEGIIFIHDAVRCLVTPQLIQTCYRESMEKGSAIPVVPIKDSIRMLESNGSKAIDRGILRAVQTPQTFRSEVIMPSFDLDYRDSFTDEATVVEQGGHNVHLIEGEDTNIKITVPSDLDIAMEVIKKRKL